MTCSTCGKPREIPSDDFRAWFMQRPPEPFTPLREFLSDYCTCEVASDGVSD